MPNVIDLCRVGDVRAYLGMKSAQVAVISTTIAASIVAGLRTVTPAAMANIAVGSIVVVDTGANKEFVLVTVVTSTTFTGIFALSHTGPVQVVDETNDILGRVITAASTQWIRKLGQTNQDGSIPTASPLVQLVDYDEHYDGNGGTRIFLRHAPIASASVVTVWGSSIPASLAETDSGYVIDQSKKSLAIRGSESNVLSRSSSSSYKFTKGVQNIHVVYRAGFVQTPDDIVDCCIEMVALNYKRRNWIDQSQDAKPDTMGTVRYRDWELPPKIVSCMDFYSRLAPV